MSEQESLLPLSASQREMLEEAVSGYQKAVTADVARYLHDRGITQETARTYRLGVVADPFPGHARFRDFLSIPYLGHDGRVLQVRFRCLQEHNHRDLGHGKYMTVADDPARIFNVGAIHRAADTIHVAEGELDALVLNQAGLPAVAVPGANNWKKHHRKMLAGFSRVFVWGDPDDAGAEMVNKITRSLRQAKGVRLREGDVTDTFLAHGADHLRELVSAS